MNHLCPICQIHVEYESQDNSSPVDEFTVVWECIIDNEDGHEVLIFKDGYWLISEGDLTLTYDPEINVTAMSINNIQNISFNLKIEFENATPILDKYKKLKAFS